MDDNCVIRYNCVAMMTLCLSWNTSNVNPSVTALKAISLSPLLSIFPKLEYGIMYYVLSFILVVVYAVCAAAVRFV